MKYGKYLYLSILIFNVSFLIGCATITTWKSTGISIYHIEDIELKKGADGQVVLLQSGCLKKSYFPFLPLFMVQSPEKRVYYYTYEGYKDKSLLCSFQLKADNKIPNIVTKKNGVLFFTNQTPHLNMFALNKLPPEDIYLLKNNPFCSVDSTFTRRIFIPYDSTFDSNTDTVWLKCYSPLDPLQLLPGEIREEMEGYCVNMWRLLFVPIPFAIDVVTCPLQAIMLINLH